MKEERISTINDIKWVAMQEMHANISSEHE